MKSLQVIAERSIFCSPPQAAVVMMAIRASVVRSFIVSILACLRKFSWLEAFRFRASSPPAWQDVREPLKSGIVFVVDERCYGDVASRGRHPVARQHVQRI